MLGIGGYEPWCRVERAWDVTSEFLEYWSIKGVILDVDNVLKRKGEKQVLPEAMTMVREWQAKGIKVCLLSNNFESKVRRIAEQLGLGDSYVACDVLHTPFKPHPRGYELALAKLDLPAAEAIMIGDQLMTDVRGANEVGIQAIWVERLSKRESVGTLLFHRSREKVILWLWSRRGLMIPHISER